MPENHTRSHQDNVAGNTDRPGKVAPDDNSKPVATGGPQFGEPAPTPDPTHFVVMHGSDKEAYSILDSEKGSILPREIPQGPKPEPALTLEAALASKGSEVVQAIEKAGQIVFHAVGDTGNTRSAQDENTVTDKLVADFENEDDKDVPSFCYNVGDVVYSFGEAKYYYDQFYDPYRDYPAPIFAIAGNHDGMVAPGSSTPTLKAFQENFCDYKSPNFHRTPEAGNLARTAGKQPGVYFTLQAPFVRILGLYSNCLENPGVISSQKGSSHPYPALPDYQLEYLTAALERIKTEKFPGAVIIAVHHPPYIAIAKPDGRGNSAGKHVGSPLMLAEIDAICSKVEVWPHAVLSGHAHNYQRFTRYNAGRETPYVVCGNSGHAHNLLTKKGMPTLRVPVTQDPLSNGSDRVIFEDYDDQGFGYLRIVVDESQLQIQYHPASDGGLSKTPDDSVTVQLTTRKLIPSRLK
jgi:Calcineurin-like phosphoesterase